MKNSTIIQNKKAVFNYEIEETIVAGLVLNGWMVKSIRKGKISASDGTYVYIKNGEAFLTGLHITHEDKNETTDLKLLMHKKEINKLNGKFQEKGMTIIMTKLFWNRGMVKAEIAVGKGKKEYDKRQKIKERESKKEAERMMKKVIKNDF